MHLPALLFAGCSALRDYEKHLFPDRYVLLRGGQLSFSHRQQRLFILVTVRRVGMDTIASRRDRSLSFYGPIASLSVFKLAGTMWTSGA